MKKWEYLAVDLMPLFPVFILNRIHGLVFCFYSINDSNLALLTGPVIMRVLIKLTEV